MPTNIPNKIKRLSLFLQYCFLVLSVVIVSYLAAELAKGNSDLAAWVQAVGSITAILGSFAIAKEQSDQAERKRMEERFQEEADLCRTGLMISVDAASALGNIVRKFTNAQTQGLLSHIGVERIEELLIALRSLAEKNLTFAIHANILLMQTELAYSLTAIRQVNSGGAVDNDRIRKAKTRMKRVEGVRDALFDLAKNQYKVPEMALL